MTYYNTLGNRLKRGLLQFSENISLGLQKTQRKFVADMIYGITASGSSKLTRIGRSLKEGIALKKTEERLRRNLANFSQTDLLMSNLLEEVRPSLGDNTMLLVDLSDVTKACSPKMEAIGSVRDGSTGKFADGYWTMGVVALTDETQHPVPVYEKLFPCKDQGGEGFNAETEKALQNLRENFQPSVVRVFDRGFDSGKTLRDLSGRDEKFILRVNQNRVAVHSGQKTLIQDIVRSLNCEHKMRFQSKTGNISECLIGMTQVILSNEKNLRVNLVVCKNFGKEPLVLYTNLDENLDTLAVRVVKGYLTRWRIEEFYAFKKQGLGFEEFRVRRLKAIQNLDILLTAAAAFIALQCDKVNHGTLAVELIQLSKPVEKVAVFLKSTKFLCYALFDGILCALGSLRKTPHRVPTATIVYQLRFQGA